MLTLAPTLTLTLVNARGRDGTDVNSLRRSLCGLDASCGCPLCKVGPKRSLGCLSCKVGPRRSFGCSVLFHQIRCCTHYVLNIIFHMLVTLTSRVTIFYLLFDPFTNYEFDNIV